MITWPYVGDYYGDKFMGRTKFMPKLDAKFDFIHMEVRYRSKHQSAMREFGELPKQVSHIAQWI